MSNEFTYSLPSNKERRIRCIIPWLCIIPLTILLYTFVFHDFGESPSLNIAYSITCSSLLAGFFIWMPFFSVWEWPEHIVITKAVDKWLQNNTPELTPIYTSNKLRFRLGDKYWLWIAPNDWWIVNEKPMWEEKTILYTGTVGGLIERYWKNKVQKILNQYVKEYHAKTN